MTEFELILMDNTEPNIPLNEMSLDFLAYSLKNGDITFEEISEKNKQEMIKKCYINPDGTPFHRIKVINYPIKFISPEVKPLKTQEEEDEKQKEKEKQKEAMMLVLFEMYKSF